MQKVDLVWSEFWEIHSCWGIFVGLRCYANLIGVGRVSCACVSEGGVADGGGICCLL